MSRRLAAVNPPVSERRDAPMLGVALAASAMVLVAGAHAGAKLLGPEFPVGQIVFFRTLVAGGAMVGYLAARGQLAGVRFVRPGMHLIRALFAAVSMLCATLAVQHMPLAEATVLMMVSPMISTSLAAFFLGEAVGWRRWSAITVGFVGVLAMLRPDGEGVVQLVALLPLASAVGYGASMTMTRHMRETETGPAMLLSLYLVLTVIGGVSCLIWWTPMTPESWAIMLGIGAMAAFFSFAFTQCYIYAPVSLIAPIDFTLLVWATVIGYFGWGEVPDWWTVAGATLIVGSGLYIALREAALAGRRRLSARSQPESP